LSPFIDDEQEGYIPKYREELDSLKSAAQVIQGKKSALEDDDASDVESDDEDEYTRELAQEQKSKKRKFSEGGDDDEDVDEDDDEEEVPDEKPAAAKPAKKMSKRQQEQQQAKEEKEMAVGMMGKKAKRLYNRMQVLLVHLPLSLVWKCAAAVMYLLSYLPPSLPALLTCHTMPFILIVRHRQEARCYRPPRGKASKVGRKRGGRSRQEVRLPSLCPHLLENWKPKYKRALTFVCARVWLLPPPVLLATFSIWKRR
jgi:hypothetical protein